MGPSTRAADPALSGKKSKSHPVFAGDSRMAARCRELDWSQTSLGAVQRWPSSLKSLTAALLASRNPILMFWGPDLIMIYNDAFAPSLGAERDARGLGAKGREFWTDVWPVIGAQLEGVMERGESFWFENALVPIERGGVMHDAWWTYSYSPTRDESGDVSGILVVCQETTASVIAQAQLAVANRDLEIARARLATAFEKAPAFFAMLRGEDYRIEMANEAYFRLVGRANIIGKPLLEVVPEVGPQGFTGLLDTVRRTGEPFVGREVPVRFDDRDGHGPRERYVDFVYQAMIDADGSHSGVIVHGYDVTDHVLTRRAVEEAKKEAEAANRAKTEFLAVMSHELRTPLNAIDGYAELLEMEVHGALTPQQRQDLTRIRKSQRHLLTLINGVLNFTRVESGNAHYDIGPVRLADVLASCDALMRPQMEHRGLTFNVDLCSGELAVSADADKLQQILLNLLTNASKFTPAGGRVRMWCESSADKVRITVADTGRGIPPEQVERIFEAFVQVDSRLTRTEEGVGLGLAISRDLARGMHGEITLVSEVGKGSAFTVTIPRAPELPGQ
jgi:signal transduction histidine kinase